MGNTSANKGSPLSGDSHLIPSNEEDYHEKSTTCSCNPKVEFNDYGDLVVRHHTIMTGLNAFLREVNSILNPKNNDS